MSDLVPQARLTAALWECDRHCAALLEALQDWHSRPTPDALALDSDSSLRRLTDQILYRFTKLQDAMGERLIPATLGHGQRLCQVEGQPVCRLIKSPVTFGPSRPTDPPSHPARGRSPRLIANHALFAL